MNTTPLQDAFRTLLKAAATVAEAGDEVHAPPAGGWNADQILAHVALVNAVTITAVSRVTSGANTTYDNRMALDPWTIDRVISLAGGSAGLQVRIAAQGEALSALGAILSETELDTPLPTLLLSNGEVLNLKCRSFVPVEYCSTLPAKTAALSQRSTSITQKR